MDSSGSEWDIMTSPCKQGN